MYDVIIIGAGPAGITAGLYAKRANLKPLIFYEDISSLEKAEKIENYYGFVTPISGQELYKNGIEQAKNLGVEVKKEEVLNIEFIDLNKFKVITNVDEYITKTIILATGNKRNTSKISGIKKFEGRGISYCAICDGFFYRNKNVAVLGNGNYAILETNDLLNIANKITILTNGQKSPEFRADNVETNTRQIKELHGDDKVKEVIFKDGSKLLIDGLFIAEGVAGSNEFAKKLGIIIKDNKIIVDENMQTNVKGIFACGDCTKGIMQISKAVYEGTVAGLSVIKYTKNNL